SLAKNRINSLAAPTKPPESKPASADGSATELAFWDAVKNSDRFEDFQAYLKTYPNGAFTELAENRIRVLEPAKAKDPVVGIWRGTSPGGDKKYEVDFTSDGHVSWRTTFRGEVATESGTWKRSGNSVSTETEWQGQKYNNQATLNGDTLQGSSLDGKYKF